MADLKWMLVLAAVAALLLFSTPFRGNFPLNDDPYYSQVVFNFLNGNFVFTLSPIAATTFLHAVYGYLFSAIFGPLLNFLGPHAVLRVSIMVLTIVYVLVAFKFGRLLGLKERESFLLSLLLLTNPVVFDMALTFMTDITFSLMFLLGMYFYAKGLDGKGKNDLLFGSVFSGAAFLVRQVGLLLPLGALLALAYRKRGIPDMGDMARVILPAAAISVGGAYWFYVIMGGLSNHVFISGLQYGLRLSRIALNLSFYLFPLALLLPVANGWKPRRPLVFAIVVLAIVPFVIFDQSKHGWIFPFIQNSFGQSGAGMVYMAPAMTGEARQAAFAPWMLWLFLVSSLALLAYSASNMDVAGLKPHILTLLLLIVPYFFAMLATNIFFDRYLIPLFPLLFFFAVRSARGMKYGTAAIAVTIIIMGGLSWYYNYNYLSLQEANRQAIDFLLVSGGVPREKIDGGIDFCQKNRFGGLIPRDAPSSGSVSGWCESGDYVTSLAPLAGYVQLGSFGYRDPFGRELGSVFALVRDNL